jgi:iron complex outermembrane receptor protein
MRRGAFKSEFTGGYNYNKTEIDRIATNPATLQAIDPTAVRFGRTEVGRLEVGSPRTKLFLGSVYSYGPWKLSSTSTRYGSVTVRGATPALDQTFEGKWLMDLALSYTANRFEFTLGADNVLDEYPDEVIFANSTFGQLPYSSSSPFGFNGAFVYGNVRYRW